MIKNKITVFNPTGKIVILEATIAQRLKDLNGKKLGIIDNKKENANILLSSLKSIFESNFKFSRTLYFAKKFPAEPADFLDEVADKCDFVINGVGH